MFSSSNQSKPAFSFGGGSNTGATNQASATGTGLFGNSQTQGSGATSQNNTGGFSFGNNNNNNSNPGGLFGNQAPTTSSGGLFGNNTAANASGSMFGNNKPATTGGLFGNSATNATGGLFGNNNASTSSAPGGLFGRTTTGGLFGSSNNNNQFSQLGGMQQQQQQQPQIPSLEGNGNPYGINLTIPTTQQAPITTKTSIPKDMPKPLTTAPKTMSSSLVNQLKRKRSASSLSSKSDSLTNTSKLSFFQKISNSINHSLENVTGIFSSNKTENKDSRSENNLEIESRNKSRRNNYYPMRVSKRVIPKHDYRRLIMRYPSGAFKNYEDINPDDVIVKKQKTISTGIKKHRFKKSPAIMKNINKESTKKPSFEPSNNKTENTEKLPTKKTDNKKDQNQKSKDSAAESQPNTSGYNISNNEYWCIPSIADLKLLSESELSHVEDFIAGRKGYGQVSFSHPVDLTEFIGNWERLLDGAIKFMPKVVKIYYDVPEEQKPSPGNGINVPAVVTIQNIFATNRETKEIVTDPSSSEVIALTKKMKAFNGMKFINFESTNGIFTFMVEHFSVWGFVDEEDETLDKETVDRFKRQQSKEKEIQQQKLEMMEDVIERQKIERPKIYNKLTEFYPIEDPTGDETYIHRKSKKHFVPSVPGGWGFRPGAFDTQIMDEFDNEDKQLTKIDVLENQVDEYEQDGEIDNDQSGLLSENSYSEGEDEYEDDPEELNLEQNFEDLVETKAYEPEVNEYNMLSIKTQPEFPIAKDWDHQLVLASGFNSVFNKEREYNTFNKLSNISQLNEILFNPPDEEMEIVKTEKPTERSKYFYNSDIPSTIKLHYERITLKSRSNKFPLVSTDYTTSFTPIVENLKKYENFEMWDLAARLFDDSYILKQFNNKDIQLCEQDEDLMVYLLEVKRRELVVEWLRKYNKEITARTLKNYESDPLECIFILLATGNIVDAIEYAMKTNNNNLAVIITLADSNDKSVRKSAMNQLNDWKRSSSLKYIPQVVVKIYQILAGLILKTDPFYDVTERLDWSVALSVFLKYGDTDKSLKESVGEFLSYSLDKKPDVTDKAYSLFKLFSYPNEVTYDVLESTFSPFSNTVDKELQDYFFEFFIYEFLVRSSQQVTCPNWESFGDSITLEFAKQLEECRLFREAIFVLCHLNNDATCEREIKRILNVRVNELGYLENNNVLKDLSVSFDVPDKTLHLARAMKFKSLKNYWQQTESLLDADCVLEAHEPLLLELAPLSIIKKGKLYEKLFELLNRFENPTRIPNWTIGGEIYKNYLELLQLYSDKSNFSKNQTNIKNLSKSIITNIGLLKLETPEIKIALNIIVKKVSEIVFDNRYLDIISSESLLSLSISESTKNYVKVRAAGLSEA
ncbi:hypothetical protein B5S33_g764 [[Candida] boidinii]|nr:hypothetical protein B5S33_g764 [[Candida] boidinii]